MKGKTTIFFHVGLGKTGTTFLQDRFFPSLKGIDYLPRNKFYKAKDYIRNSQSPSILVSREFDQQLESEARKFADVFPDAKPIIVLRRPDSYIASQYRRAVKNGFTGEFTDFFNLQSDNGIFKMKDLEFDKQLQQLSAIFSNPAIVLFYEDMKSDLGDFLHQWLQILSASSDINRLNQRRKHASYTEAQLLFLQGFSNRIDLRKRPRKSMDPLAFIARIIRAVFRYSILYVGRFYTPSRQLINPSDLDAVERHYRAMWLDLCEQYKR